MKKYYIIIKNAQFGPYTLNELKEIEITRETLVWTSEIENWAKAETFKELHGFINNIPPPTPPPIPKHIAKAETLKQKPELNSKAKSRTAKEIKSAINFLKISFLIAVFSLPIFYFVIYDANRYDDGKIQFKNGAIYGVERDDIIAKFIYYQDIQDLGSDWAIKNRKKKIMELAIHNSLIVLAISFVFLLLIRYISNGTKWVNKHAK